MNAGRRLADAWCVLRTRSDGVVAARPGSDPATWISLTAAHTPAAEALALAAAHTLSPAAEAALQPAIEPTAGVITDARDAHLLRRLQELDQSYGVLGGATDTPAARGWLEILEHMHAARRLWSTPCGVWPTLPLSTLRRAQLVAATMPRRVLIWGDLDGAALPLCERAAVTVLQPDAYVRAWLGRQAEDRGLCVRWLPEATRLGPGEAFDTILAAAAGVDADAQMLTAVASHLRPGGQLLISARHPFSVSIRAQAGALGLRLTDTAPDLDIPLLPGGWAVDATADLLCFEMTATSRCTNALACDSKLPQALRDIGKACPPPLVRTELLCLAPAAAPAAAPVPAAAPAAQTQPNAATRLLDALACLGPARPLKRSTASTQDAERFWWVGEDGISLCGHLVADPGYLFVAMQPYHAATEWAALQSAMFVLGDHLTRVRPMRREWAGLQEFRFG